MKRKSKSLSLLWLMAAQSTASTSSSQNTKLDLSYLHRVQPSALAEVLQERLQKYSNVEIDLSSSLIGKDIKSIVSIFKNIQDSASIDLTARSNDWSSKDGHMLIEAFLKRSENFNNKEPIMETKVNPENEEAKVKKSEVESLPKFPFHSLDLGWNYFGDDDTRESKKFLKALQKLVYESSSSQESFVLRLDVCALSPATCRAIGKGMIDRYGDKETTATTTEIKPLTLHLTKNERIGDAGAAALSAAIRSIASKNKDAVVFEVLNLSACGIGDTGAEALAIALADHPSSVRHLILSNNRISDEGAAILGRALTTPKHQLGQLETLDLSNNIGIGDAGARTLAHTVERGSIEKLILRSCHVRADGISAFAKVLKTLGDKKLRSKSLVIDLSGNPIGILRKNKKSGGYSASALKSKATATTAAYMNIIGKTVQRGLKEIGFSESQNTLESDDEEESRMNDGDNFECAEQKETKCGALAFADAFIDEDDGEDCSHAEDDLAEDKEVCNITLGLRHCALDTRAAEALAAVVHEGKEKKGINIEVDVRMNNVLEDEMVMALRGDKCFDADLVDMAEKHLDALERIRDARRRAAEAARAAARRMRAEAEMEAAWGSAVDMGVDYDADYDEDVSDSYADYDEDMHDYN